MVKFRSDMGVSLIDSMGDDQTICQAARVSTGNDIAGYTESKGLIRYLVREKHVSTLEHNTFTFKIETPLWTTAQIQRHRTFSYNQISARYSEVPLEFWYPKASRPLHNRGSGAYPDLVEHENQIETISKLHDSIATTVRTAVDEYKTLLEQGVATEVARTVLPTGLYTRYFMSGNLKNFLDFIEKRTVPNAQIEVQSVAEQMLEQIEDVVPIAVGAWKEYYGN